NEPMTRQRMVPEHAPQCRRGACQQQRGAEHEQSLTGEEKAAESQSEVRLKDETEARPDAHILERFRQDGGQRPQQDGHERDAVEPADRDAHGVAEAAGPSERKAPGGLVAVECPPYVSGGWIPAKPSQIGAIDPSEAQQRYHDREADYDCRADPWELPDQPSTERCCA